MAIYTRMGAPVQIVKAEKRRRWWAHFGGHTRVWDQDPTKLKLWTKAKERQEFDLWWIKANQIGPYPDGSGRDNIGKPLGYGKDGWLDENEFRADDGIKEIHEVCEDAAKGRIIIMNLQTGKPVTREDVAKRFE